MSSEGPQRALSMPNSSGGGAKRGVPPARSDEDFKVPPPKKRKNAPRSPLPEFPDPMIDDVSNPRAEDIENVRPGARSRRRDSVPATPSGPKQSKPRRHSTAPRTGRKKIRDCDLVKEMEDVNVNIKKLAERRIESLAIHRTLRAAILSHKFEEKRFLAARKRFEEECDLLRKRADGSYREKELQKKFNHLQEKFNGQVSANQDAQSRLEATEKANDELRKRNAMLREEVGKARLTNQELDSKLSKAKGHNTILKTASQKLSETRDKLLNQVAEARANAELWQSKFKLYESMHAAVEQENIALKENEQRRSQADSNATYDKYSDEMVQKVREIQEQCNAQLQAANDAAEAKVKSQLTALDKQVNETGAQLAKARNDAAAATSKLNLAVQEQARVERQLAVVSKQKSILEAENAKHLERERDFMNEIAAKNKSLAVRRASLDELQNKMNKVVEERDALSARGRLFGDDEAIFEKLLGNLERYTDLEEARDTKRQAAVAKFLTQQNTEAAKQREEAGRQAAEARAAYSKFIEKEDSRQEEDTKRRKSRGPVRRHAQQQPAAPMVVALKGKSDKQVDPPETRSIKAKKSRQEARASAQAV